MTKKKLFRPLMIAAAVLVLNLSACVSLAADVTPPPGFQPTQVIRPAAVETVFPVVPPDPSGGAAIYAEKCEPCHGPAGMGNGSQSANLPNPPPSIGSPDLARASRPVDWFTIVTHGNLQKMMPGFSGSLDDRQRWDVVAYVYSLSMPAAEIAQGRVLFEQNCVACHTERGEGGGDTPAWTEPSRLAKLSAREMADIILNGSGQMPAFAGQLDEDQAWAAAAYARSLTFASTPPGGQVAQATPEAGTPQPAGTQPAQGTPVASEQATPAPDQPVTITGAVINGSGGSVPAGLKVTLRGFDQMQPSVTLDTETGEGGAFSFENIETGAGRVYMAVVSYNNYTFNSDILHSDDLAAGNTRLDLQIFDTTPDTSALVADRMHIFFDISQPGIVQVGQLYIISNPSSKMVVAANPDEAVLKFDLPAGSSNLSFQDGSIGDRYVQTETGFGDTASIPPGSGSHQVLFAYNIPFDRKLDVSLRMPIPVSAAVVIAPASGVRLQSSQLQDMGVKTMQDVQVHLYSASSLPAGSTLDISFSGRTGDGALDQNALFNLLVGAAALLMAAGVVLWWFMRRRYAFQAAGGQDDLPEQAPDDVDSLVEAIVALDDQYQAGEIAQEAYEQRRGELKDRLRQARDGQQAR